MNCSASNYFRSPAMPTMIGVTGAPGTGKSTLVDRLAATYRRAGRTVGIIAVDPTSPFTGGAILGDRIRMQGHASDAGIFIRSMATRGFLGGLARATADVALLLDAAGKEIILIETVGVGQDEVDIVRLADCTLVLLVPGLGDDVQNMKAGLMEIGRHLRAEQIRPRRRDRLEQQSKPCSNLPTIATAGIPPIVRTTATENAALTSSPWDRASFCSSAKTAPELRAREIGSLEAPPGRNARSALARALARQQRKAKRRLAALAQQVAATQETIPTRQSTNYLHAAPKSKL